MAEQGIITRQDADRWKAYPLLLASRDDFSGVAEYFVEYIRQQLDARFGPRLYTDGLRIYTTLDLDVQQAAERAMEAQLSAIEAGTYGPYKHQTYATYLERKAESEDEVGPAQSPYLQGLAVTLEAKTGYILAMVGGRDFEDSKFNRATQALRQPGSTFKPIVYTAAVRAGIPLTTIMVDEPITVEMPGAQEPWEPQNYDNNFGGPMPLRQALYKSVNIVAIKLGHGNRRGSGHRRGDPLRTRRLPDSRRPVDPPRLGGRQAAGADRGVHRLCQPGGARHADGDSPGRGPAGEHPLAAASPGSNRSWTRRWRGS